MDELDDRFALDKNHIDPEKLSDEDKMRLLMTRRNHAMANNYQQMVMQLNLMISDLEIKIENANEARMNDDTAEKKKTRRSRPDNLPTRRRVR